MENLHQVKKVMSNDVLINRIQHILMLKSKFLPDVGLLEGKTGIVLAFACLYRHTCNKYTMRN